MDFSISPIGFNPYVNTNFMDLDTDIGKFQLFGCNNSSIFSALPTLNQYNVPGNTATSSNSGKTTGQNNTSGQMYNPMNPWSMQEGYFDYMNKYRDFYHKYNLEQQKMTRSADASVNAPMRGIEEAAQNLKDKIKENEQDQVMAAYKAYIDAVKLAYPDISPQELKSQALASYKQMNGGKSLVDDLKEYGSGSFMDGFNKTVSLGFYNRTSSEDNISQITGLAPGKAESAKNVIGNVAGAGVWAGLGFLAAKLCPKKFPRFGKGNLLPMIASGAAAAGSLILSNIFGSK